MLKNNDFIKRKVGDDVLLLPTGSTAQKFNGMITVSAVGESIWDQIEEVQSFEELVSRLEQEYDADRQTIAADCSAFLMQLLQSGLVRPSGEKW